MAAFCATLILVLNKLSPWDNQPTRSFRSLADSVAAEEKALPNVPESTRLDDKSCARSDARRPRQFEREAERWQTWSRVLNVSPQQRRAKMRPQLAQRELSARNPPPFAATLTSLELVGWPEVGGNHELELAGAFRLFLMLAGWLAALRWFAR